MSRRRVMSSLKRNRKKIQKWNDKCQPKLILPIGSFKNIGFKILHTDSPRKNPHSQDPYIQPDVDPESDEFSTK